MSRDKTIQIRFLNQIKELMPDNFSFVDSLANILEISQDSVYRRLRAETELSITEVATLTKHFNISFDLFTKDSGNVTFGYRSMQDEAGFKKHLLGILDTMHKTVQPENKLVTYAAIDIPLFYHFKYDELGAFKMFYWMKAVNSYESMQNKQFSMDVMDPEIIEIGKQIWEAYKKVPCREIWSDETGNSLVKQIEFYWESGNFKSKEDALQICMQARDQLEMIKRQAEISSKDFSENRSDESKYLLYHSDIEIGNNCIFAQREHAKFVFLTFNTFNALLTPDLKFTKEIESWLDNLMRKSTLISGVAQRHRYQFFERAMAKVTRLYNKIESY